VKLLARGLFSTSLFLSGLFLGGFTVQRWEDHYPRAVEELPPRVWQATVYLPLVDNAGQPFSDELWQEAVEVFVSRFGGATLGGPQDGRWLDAQERVHREPIRPVVISFERRKLGDFRRTLREVGERLGQEAMYVLLEEPRVELVQVGPERSEKDH
jgi:hypothetical protein